MGIEGGLGMTFLGGGDLCIIGSMVCSKHVVYHKRIYKKKNDHMSTTLRIQILNTFGHKNFINHVGNL